MNLILLDDSDRVGVNLVRLTGRRFLHWRDVLRGSDGSSCKVGFLHGTIGSGRAVVCSDDSVTLEVECLSPPPEPLPLSLFIALPRPKTFRKVLHVAVSFGVKRIAFFGSWKVEKSYWSSPLLVNPDLELEIRLALEQAVDTIPPVITFHPRFKPFVEDEFPSLASHSQILLAHPGSPLPCPIASTTALSLILGPEGGFTPYETQMFQTAGATPIHLGQRILRTEVALPALLGRLSF